MAPEKHLVRGKFDRSLEFSPCAALFFVLSLQTSCFSLLDTFKSAAAPGFPLPTLQPGKFL